MAQADDLPTLFRKLDHANRMLAHCEAVSQRPRRFVVECRAIDGSFYIAEIDVAATDLSSVIRDVLDGQFSRPARVYELTDVSAEVAAKIAASYCDFEADPHHHVAEFVEAHGFCVPDVEANR